MRLLLPIATALLAACTPAKSVNPDPMQTPDLVAEAPTSVPTGNFARTRLSEARRAKCLAAGGTVQVVGMAANEACVRRFADAGKACTDSENCEGKCLVSGPHPPDGMVQTGQCQTTDNGFGCFTELRGGKAVGGICVD